MITSTLPVIPLFEPCDTETLSAARQPAPSAQDIEGIPESISSKHLCLCIQEIVDIQRRIPTANYLLKSVPLLKMFGSRSSEDDEPVLQQFQQLESWSEPLCSTGIGLLPSKDDLYVIFHGKQHDNRCDNYMIVEKHSLTMLKYPIIREQTHFKLGPSAETDVMKSRLKQVDPIVVEINGFIYVLCQSIGWTGCSKDSIVFQVYDKSKDKWTELDAPPFMHCRKKIPYSDSVMHLVVGDKFYVSSLWVSCEFCTKTRKWGPCKLFGKNMNEGMDDGRWGCPFPFAGNGLVVYEDFLVCTSFRWTKDVIAYKVSCDGVVQSGQKLFTGLDDELKKCSGSYLTDLGDGNFCLMLTKYDDLFECGISPTIKLLLFKVSKSPDGQTLRCTAPGDVKVSTLALEDPERPPLKVEQQKRYNISSFFAY